MKPSTRRELDIDKILEGQVQRANRRREENEAVLVLQGGNTKITTGNQSETGVQGAAKGHIFVNCRHIESCPPTRATTNTLLGGDPLSWWHAGGPTD